MTCVLDHDGSPFFAGTYFPDQPRHGQPSFRQLLEAITEAWTKRPDEVAGAAGRIREALTPHGRPQRGGRRSTRRRWTRPFEARERLRRRVGRLRRGAEVPAVDDPRLPAAARAEASRSRHAHGRQDAGRDGCGRDPRPADRWVRAVRRRPGLGGAALREDALRQRAADVGLRAVGGRARRRAGPPGRAGRSPTSCWPSCSPPRVPSRPRSTPTPRARRAPSTSGRPTRWRRPSGAEDAEWACTLLGVTEQGTFEHGTSTLQMQAQPDDTERWETRAPRRSTTSARSGCDRPATTRWSRPGTVWRSRAWSTPARSSTRPGSWSRGRAVCDVPGRRTPARGSAAAGLPRRRGGVARRGAGGPRLPGHRLPGPGLRHG